MPQAARSVQPGRHRVFTAPCDTARAFLSQSSVKYTTAYGPAARREGRHQRQGRAYTAAAASNRRCWRLCRRRLSEGGDAQIVKMSNPIDIFQPRVAAIIAC